MTSDRSPCQLIGRPKYVTASPYSANGIVPPSLIRGADSTGVRGPRPAAPISRWRTSHSGHERWNGGQHMRTRATANGLVDVTSTWARDLALGRVKLYFARTLEYPYDNLPVSVFLFYRKKSKDNTANEKWYIKRAFRDVFRRYDQTAKGIRAARPANMDSKLHVSRASPAYGPQPDRAGIFHGPRP